MKLVLATRYAQPRAAIRREPTARHQQMDVRMPLERARPGMQHVQRADPMRAEEVWISAEFGEGIEGGAEKRGEQGPLMRTNNPPQF
jgi:hypothetical protein